MASLRQIRRHPAWAAAVVTASVLVSAGCATSSVPQVSSEPNGAAVYQLRGGHIADYVGTTPAQWSEPVNSSLFGSPFSNVVSYIVLFPIFFPAALAAWIGDAWEGLQEPHGKRTYAALYHGRFFTPAAISEREVHFDFSTATGQPVPDSIIRDLRGRFVVGCDTVYVRRELGEPRAKTALPSEEERWDYGDFEVIVGHAPSGYLAFHDLRPTSREPASH